MKSDDLAYLRGQLRDFIAAGISRMAHSGDTQFDYVVFMDDMKESTGRSRMQAAVINEAVEFFQKNHVSAKFDEASEAIEVRLNLERCTLDARQARDLTTAQNMFRAHIGID